MRFTIMAPVIIDENPSMIALAVRTAYRAEDTPVSSDTTTNMFNGTRNREESWQCTVRRIR